MIVWSDADKIKLATTKNRLAIVAGYLQIEGIHTVLDAQVFPTNYAPFASTW